MSKPIASAAGAAMPVEGHKTRRALLRLFRAAPALAILPAAGSALALASAASPVHSDAALLAMRPAIDAAERELDAALDALDAAEEAYSDKEPDRPAEPGDNLLGEQRAIDALAGGDHNKEAQDALCCVGGLRTSGSRLRAGDRTPEGRVRRNCRA